MTRELFLGSEVRLRIETCEELGFYNKTYRRDYGASYNVIADSREQVSKLREALLKYLKLTSMTIIVQGLCQARQLTNVNERGGYVQSEPASVLNNRQFVGT